MRIVLDLQGAQSNSRHRGIGRYSLAMAKTFAEEAGNHELWLMLNGRHDEASLSLLGQFGNTIPRERIVFNELPDGIAGCHRGNMQRIAAAEMSQARLLTSLNPDCIWHSSMFEGWSDDSIVTLGSGQDDAKHAATLYDLIPLMHPALHLRDAAYRDWYYRRLALLKRCGLLLALSDHSRREAIASLQIPEDRVAVVFGAADPLFKPLVVDSDCRARWRRAWNLLDGFVLYVGGYDAHKNVETLIQAYAELPAELRQQQPLVLAGHSQEAARTRLLALARKHRLPREAVVFTGSISDEELAALYSACTVFVAPSLHEGLGLPTLEAMACGAPVIASNVTSLPEVIGCDAALFDPRSRSSIAAKLHEVLSMPVMRDFLRQHGVRQAAKFTWATSAKYALAAIDARYPLPRTGTCRHGRPRLAYVSPLPPARSGIADYSVRLLRELDAHYEIDLVVDQPELLDPWLQANFALRSTDWLRRQAYVERVLYHIGNSPFHAHMFALLRRHPGVVMLHDSMLGAVRNWMAQKSGDKTAFSRLLYADHGYQALIHDQQHGRASTVDAWPMNRDVIEEALGIIVHSEYAIEQARRYYGPGVQGKFTIVPFPKEGVCSERRLARRLLEFGSDDFVVCSFGMMAPTKLNHRLLDAWMMSPLGADPHCHLVFVGEREGGDYGRQLAAAIDASPSRKRIHVTGFAEPESYAGYLAAADAVVQLRTTSRGETSAAVFDALAHGLPVIVNAHGSMAELPAEAAIVLPDRFEDSELANGLARLYRDQECRLKLGDAARILIAQRHHPAAMAIRYRDAIEYFTGDTPEAESARMQARMLAMDRLSVDDLSWCRRFMSSLSGVGLPKIFVDVSATSRSGLHTGIERVVRGALSELLRSDQRECRVEPVKLDHGRYLYATSYGLHLLGLPVMELSEEPVQAAAGDILLGLDWVADALPAEAALLEAWRMRGVRLYFVVYDLLPVRLPHRFPDGIAMMHARWLACIGKYADGLLCISRAVADDVRRWFDQHPPDRNDELMIGYFHPGNDPASTCPTTGLPDDAEQVLAYLSKLPSFLMVGTLEPRKGHALVLDAFERLWAEGADMALVIVGREGWMSQLLAMRLRDHAQSGRRLFWIERASDEYLERIYDSVKALVAASEGEGFGLPLVEAANRQLPVIARDIPVFREIAADFAVFFDGDNLDSLMAALRQAAAAGNRPSALLSSGGPSWTSAAQTIREMLATSRHPHWLESWRQSPEHQTN